MVILYDLIVKMASGDQGGRMDKKYRAVVFKMPNNSDKAERRYVIKDMESGEIVDDAQGYGYKSAQKAYAGWAYKRRDKSKDDYWTRWRSRSGKTRVRLWMQALSRNC